MSKLILPLVFCISAVTLSAESNFVCRKLTPPQIASATAANRLLTEMQRDKFKQARKHAQAAVDANPTDPFLLGALGTIEFREGDLETAAANLNRSNQIYPCIAYVHFTLAKYDALIGDSAAAQIQLDLSNAFAPGVPEIATAWLQTHTPVGQPAQRSTALQRRAALQSAPNGLAPFSENPPQYVFPAVTQPVSFAVENNGPPNIGNGIGASSGRNARSGVGGRTAISALYADNHLPTIDMLLNGKRFRFILNLDDEPITISGAAAQKAGIIVTNPTRKKSVANAIVDDLQVANIDAHNVPVTVLGGPTDDYSRYANFTDGSVGLYSFRRSLISLDIWDGKITLAPLPATNPADVERSLAPQKRSWTNLYVVPNGSKLLANVEISTGPPRLFLLNATGGGSFFTPDAAYNATNQGQYSQISFGQDTTVHLARKTVTLSSGVGYPPQFRTLGMAIDGVLGRDALKGITLTLDFRDHLLQAN